MKKYLLMIMLCVMTGASFAGDNTAPVNIVTIESRESGYHSLFLSGAIPAQGCTNENRVIIVESGGGGSKMMLDVALAAFTTQTNVIVRVDGCTLLAPNENMELTAPKVIKVQIGSH